MGQVTLRSLLEVEDFTVHLQTNDNLRITLNRAEIEGVLSQNNVPLPLANDVSFFITDGADHVFNVTYLKATDTYAYLKQKTA